MQIVPSQGAFQTHAMIEELPDCMSNGAESEGWDQLLLPDSAIGSTALSESASLGSNPSQATTFFPLAGEGNKDGRITLIERG